jgi:2-polyprenyl-3-methyl-5-hydroxy-6-metoxy-1,4-benzoquinol methylase
MSAAAIQSQIPMARDIYRACSFVKRISEWPRGYRGDFETIQDVMDLNNPYSRTDVRHHIQHYVLETPLSQQHRNKVRAQSQVILDTLLRNKTARVLSIACGACPDFAAFISALPNDGQTIVLNDQDADAIVRSRAVFAASDHTPIVVEGNVFQRIKTLAEHGPYDLVLAGGLFDYLEDKPARLLIRSIVNKLLRPGGVMFWTNIGEGNPYRPWMECVAEWPLLERSEADVTALLAEVADTTRTDVQADETGLSLLVTTKRIT